MFYPAFPSNPINLGYPINLVQDDVYFTNSGFKKILEHVLISSDRGSNCCLEIFNVSKMYKKMVSGKVFDCKTNLPIQDAAIKGLKKQSNETIATQNTNASGEYLFEVKEFAEGTLYGSKENYSTVNLEIYQPNSTESEDDLLMNQTICLMPVDKVIPHCSRLYN